MICPDCESEMGDPVDTTYSNIRTHRAEVNQHTGDIYWCEQCEVKWLDDFLERKIRPWPG